MTKAAETIESLANSLRPLMNFSRPGPGATFTIGELASHLGVSLRTLRFYEQSGLLRPHREGIRRIYSDEDRSRLELIVALREFEVSLAGIKALLATADSGGPGIEARIVGLYDRLLAEVATANDTRIAELEGINARIARARTAVAG